MGIKNYFFTLHVFKTFYQRMNKPNIHNNIIGDISSFENEFNDVFCWTGFYFKNKVVESNRKGEIMFLSIWAQHVHIWGCDISFLPSGYIIQLFFSVSLHICKIHFFGGEFFLLPIAIPMATKIFKVMTCFE